MHETRRDQPAAADQEAAGHHNVKLLYNDLHALTDGPGSFSLEIRHSDRTFILLYDDFQK